MDPGKELRRHIPCGIFNDIKKSKQWRKINFLTNAVIYYKLYYIV